MKNLVFVALVFIAFSSFSQSIDLQDVDGKKSVNAVFSNATYKGKAALKVNPTDAQTEAKFVKLTNTNFEDGTIEIEVAGMRAASAGAQARGFVGLAFRVAEDDSKFECFYIRPTNGRANDQLRRNHSVQYISFPDHPWHRLRKETPGMYETYTDLQEGVWTPLKVKVSGQTAKLYVNGAEQPTLIVNDLKLGPDAPGTIGLWVGPGTEAYFANLKITKR